MRALTVDVSRAMTDHLLDLPFVLKVIQRFPCERSVDFQPVDEDGDSDKAIRLDIFLQLLGGIFIEDDGVIGLVLDYNSNPYISLRPTRYSLMANV